MKTKFFLVAAALTIIAAACTGDPTASGPTLRDPGAVAPSTSATSDTAVTTTTSDSTGQGGSGCCSKS